MSLKRFLILFELATLSLLVACGADQTPPGKTGEIIFVAENTNLQAGECTALHWEAVGAYEVVIDDQPVEVSGQLQVCPAASHTYKMSADYGTNLEQREVQIVVGGGQNEENYVVTPGIPAYQADSWVALGNPPGDLGYDIRYNFADHNVWYVTDGTAGFHISADGGLTWKPSNSGITSFEGTSNIPVFSATVDPHNPSTIWIGTQFTGHIYKSVDGGLTWIEKDEGVVPHAGVHFRGFTVDPRSSDIVYAQAEVDINVFTDAGKSVPDPNLPCVGGRIYRTTDGGENWSMIWEGYALTRYLWINPDDPNTMYASTGIFDRCPLNMPENSNTPWDAGGVGVLKSVDGGQNWRELGLANGLEMLHVGSLYMKPDDPKTLLAGTGAITLGGEGDPAGIVYLTTDAGETWQEVVTGDSAIGAVEYCEQDPNIAYAAGERAVYRSADGGSTWDTYSDESRGTWGPPGLYPGVPIDIQIDPDDPQCNRLFINNYIGGNFLSTNGGKSWTTATTGYSGASVFGLAVSPFDSKLVYAGVRMAAFVSQDGGDTWQSISNPELNRGVQVQALDPSNPRHLLIVEGERGWLAPPLYETFDSGTTWKNVFSLVPPDGISDADWGRMKFWEIAFAPSDSKIVYAATLNPPPDFEAQMGEDYIIGTGVYKSTDGGTNWSPANDSTIQNLGFASIAVDPNDPLTVYAGTHGGELYKTTDGGVSWKSLQSGLPSGFSIFRAITIDSLSPDTVFLGGTAGLYKSEDGGVTWKQLASGLAPEETIADIVLDSSHPGVMYVATTRGGVLYSTDAGEIFHPLQQGLDSLVGNLSVRNLALSADGSVLYAGILGQGVYRLGTP